MMNKDCLVSIIIPSYNVEAYLGRAVESCLSQTYKNLDIWIVDDGSKDGTANLAREYMAKDDRIHLTQKPNGGLASARNRGLECMLGDYVLFLDADDWLEPDTVEYYLSMLPDDDKEYLIAAGMYGVVVHDDGHEERKEYKNSASECTIAANEAIHKIGAATMNLQSSCYKLYSTKVIKDNNLRFPDGFTHAEDGLFVFNYIKKIDFLHYSPKPTWNRLYRAGSLSQVMYTHGKIFGIIAVERMYNYPDNDEKLKKTLLHFMVMRFGAIFTVALFEGAKKNKNDLVEMRKIMKPYSKAYMKGDFGFKHKLFFWVYCNGPLWLAKLQMKYFVKKHGTDTLNSDISIS